MCHEKSVGLSAMLMIFSSPITGKRRKGLDSWGEIGGTWSIVQHPGGTKRSQAAQTVRPQQMVVKKSELRDLQHSLLQPHQEAIMGHTKFVQNLFCA